MTLDPRLQAILDAIGTPENSTADKTPAQRRLAARAFMTNAQSLLIAPSPPVTDEHNVMAAGPEWDVPIRVYRPRSGQLPAFIHIHGGGWWQGELDDSDNICRQRASALDCMVLSIGYRLAPEYPYPTAVNDCWHAVRWIADNADSLGIDADRIAIGGGSAGGNLAAAVTLLARDAGAPKLVAQVLEQPVTDCTQSHPSLQEFGSGYGFSRADLEECVSFYLQGHSAADPLASPLLGRHDGLPPALIITGECDPLRDEGEQYANMLAAAGVATTLVRTPGMIHGAVELDRVLPDLTEQHRRAIAEFLATYLRD